jgi:hypothetical protein
LLLVFWWTRNLNFDLISLWNLSFWSNVGKNLYFRAKSYYFCVYGCSTIFVLLLPSHNGMLQEVHCCRCSSTSGHAEMSGHQVFQESGTLCLLCNITVFICEVMASLCAMLSLMFFTFSFLFRSVKRICSGTFSVHIVACMPLKRRVLVRMVGFISSWLHTHSSLHLYTDYTALSLVYTS